MNNGGSRRQHSKSRLGCIPCKKRHIKCDGRGPICERCEKRKVDCTFVDLAKTKTETPSMDVACQRTSLNTAQYGLSNLHLVSGLVNTAQPLHPYELQLMHQWATSTSMTIAMTRAPETMWVWQTVVPHLVQQHAFLLHTLLSLTAAHMASERNEVSDGQPYRCIALHHCCRSAAYFRQSCSESATGLSPTPAPAILVFVILNSLAALSLLPLSSPLCNNQDLDNFVSWLISLRHAVAFAGLRSSDNQDSGIARLVSKYRQRDLAYLQSCRLSVSTLAPHEQLPHLLLASFHQLGLFITASSHLSLKDAETLKLAIMQTKLWFRLVPLRPQNAMYLFLWLSSMSDDFFQMVARKCTISLAIMAHWLTVVYNAPHPWFVSDWPGRALKAIMSAVDAEGFGAGLTWISEVMS
ncbi:Cytochrome P450 [Venturia inaequalis]|nr:Cytochrome P450 [Venturia inaequalis]